jgi:aspartate 1-decarboxylase
MFLGKIHRARVTHADLHYEGSVTIDGTLMDAAGMLEHEEVHIWNVTRGSRLVTYTLRGPEGSGVVCINGAAAHGNRPGDLVILAVFGDVEEAEARRLRPRVVFVDDENRIHEIEPERAGPAMPRRIGKLAS